MGNIISVNENGKQIKSYKYDKLNRIICDENLDIDKIICYTYDNEGNIQTKTVNGKAFEYKYFDNSDRLASFNGEICDYDAIGNPKTYRNLTLSWSKGRQLNSIADGDTTLNFSYNGLGQRTQKGNTTYKYDSSGKLISLLKGAVGLEFFYGSEGVIGCSFGGSKYIFRKNLQGDITAIYNEAGQLQAKYSYTAFGECKVYNANGELDTTEDSIGNLNPFRYRSYYYDVETELYYLKTRYYDPKVGRFITIDDTQYLSPDQINGLNLYAYCLNNPIAYTDPNGRFAVMAALGVISTVLFIVGLAISVYENSNDRNNFEKTYKEDLMLYAYYVENGIDPNGKFDDSFYREVKYSKGKSYMEMLKDDYEIYKYHKLLNKNLSIEEFIDKNFNDTYAHTVIVLSYAKVITEMGINIYEFFLKKARSFGL